MKIINDLVQISVTLCFYFMLVLTLTLIFHVYFYIMWVLYYISIKCMYVAFVI